MIIHGCVLMATDYHQHVSVQAFTDQCHTQDACCHGCPCLGEAHSGGLLGLPIACHLHVCVCLYADSSERESVSSMLTMGFILSSVG